ncbi:MAG: hypothetical protein FWC94_04905 [Bacteroidales bacterium]|nr:hypothetical protein [Bacteroidales bacterium]
MENNKQTCYNETWESEFHRYFTPDIGSPLFHGFTFKQFFVFLKIRKVAKIKESKSPKSNKIQVLCPYCHNVSIQEEITRNYRCPFCYEKSYINTSQGLFSLFMKKINSVERNTKLGLPTNSARIEEKPPDGADVRGCCTTKIVNKSCKKT